MKKVLKVESGCWEWIPSPERRYGSFWKDGKQIGAHVVSFQLHKGNIPKDMVVCHTCDNTRCVNPSHLFVGTQSENILDAVSKGRHVSNLTHPKGEKAYRAQFSNEQIVEIRSIRGMTQKEIGKMFNTSQSVINGIIKRYTYAN